MPKFKGPKEFDSLEELEGYCIAAFAVGLNPDLDMDVAVEVIEILMNELDATGPKDFYNVGQQVAILASQPPLEEPDGDSEEDDDSSPLSH